MQKLNAYGIHAFSELSHCLSLVGQTTDLKTAELILLLLSQVHTVMGQISQMEKYWLITN